MNFYDLNSNFPNQMPTINNQIPAQDIFYKITELENRIKKNELRIQRLESLIGNNEINYNEPDKGMYMI